MVTGLSASTYYYYRVRAYNATATSSSSSTIEAITTAIAGIPVATAATNVGCTSFDASWDIIAGATSYKLDVSVNSNFSIFLYGYNNLDVGNVSAYNVSPTVSSTPYYYRVRAVMACGTGSNSNPITVTTATTTPAPVANEVTAPGCTGFTTSWSSVSGATGYVLDVSTSETFATYVSGYNNRNVGSDTVYDITGLANGTICSSTPSSIPRVFPAAAPTGCLYVVSRNNVIELHGRIAGN